jgi:hypothetical protein
MRIRKFAAAFAVALLPLGASLALSGAALASPVYADSQVTAGSQRVDAITAITAAASWGAANGTACTTSPTNLGNAITVVPVPSFMCAQLTAAGSNIGTEQWSIVPGSEVNIPAGVLIGINPASGLLTVTPPAGPVIPANNQEISLVVRVTDGASSAFETLVAQPIIVSGLGNCQNENVTCISAINVTASTDAVTVGGVNNNATGEVDFASTPAGAALALFNAPGGVSLGNGHLQAASARPDKYAGLSVTATDAAGATAVDTFGIEVDGRVSGTDVPQLSHGHAVAGVNSSRENVWFVLSNSDACVHFTIVGPGAINGHQGWVPATAGLNEGVYGGLLAHHGYTVFYQAVSGPADCSTHSVAPWPGSHWGYVYFVSGS